MWLLRHFFLQVLSTTKTMSKKGRKKLKIDKSDFDTDIDEVPPAVKVEIVYKDTKVVKGGETELKWG